MVLMACGWTMTVLDAMRALAEGEA